MLCGMGQTQVSDTWSNSRYHTRLKNKNESSKLQDEFYVDVTSSALAEIMKRTLCLGKMQRLFYVDVISSASAESLK